MDLSSVALIVSVVVLVFQTVILWRQTQILSIQTQLGESVELSFQLAFSSVSQRTACVNITNEGKGIARETTLHFNFLNRVGPPILYRAGDDKKLQPLGSGKNVDVFVNIPDDIPSNWILRVYFEGIQSNGRSFWGKHDLPFESATRTTKQFQVD